MKNVVKPCQRFLCRASPPSMYAFRFRKLRNTYIFFPSLNPSIKFAQLIYCMNRVFFHFFSTFCSCFDEFQFFFPHHSTVFSLCVCVLVYVTIKVTIPCTSLWKWDILFHIIITYYLTISFDVIQILLLVILFAYNRSISFSLLHHRR